MLELLPDDSPRAEDFGERLFAGRLEGGVFQKTGLFQTDFLLEHEPAFGIAHPERARFGPQPQHGALQQFLEKDELRHGRHGHRGQFAQESAFVEFGPCPT